MPIIILIFLLLCAIVFVGTKSQRKGKIKWTGAKVVEILLFVLSLTALFTSVGLFMTTAVYVSNYQYYGGPELMTGFWLSMMWLELPILFALSLILGIRVIKPKNSD